MKISPYKKYSIVNRLDNTSANAVSLVNYGANEQPFKIIKYNKNRNSSIELFESVGDILMKVTPSKIVFAKDIYANTEDIVKYLYEHNYSEYDIVETNDSFDVVSKTANPEPNAEIELGEGITALVIDEDLAPITKSQDEEVTEEVESTIEEAVEKEVEPTEEIKTESIDKFDYWKAYDSVGDDTSPDLYKYLAAGDDQGFPPDFSAVSQVFLNFTIKCIVNNDTAQFEKNVSQYKEYMTKMYQVFSDAVAKSKDDISSTGEENHNSSMDYMKVLEKSLEDQEANYTNKLNELQAKLEDISTGLVSKLDAQEKSASKELANLKEEFSQFKKELYEESKHSIVQKRTVIDREVETTQSVDAIQLQKQKKEVHWKVDSNGKWSIR